MIKLNHFEMNNPSSPLVPISLLIEIRKVKEAKEFSIDAKENDKKKLKNNRKVRVKKNGRYVKTNV